MPTRDPRISQFPQVCIVEASAGSGKTHALASRYIQLLITPALKLEDIPLRNILAITFSNKAAIEMKERILEFLKKIALDKFSSPQEKENLLSSLGVDPLFAQKKAHLVMDGLIKNYNFFQVQTIDSFINAILSGCAFKLGLSSNFKIKTDYSEYLSYSLDELIDRAGSDKDVFGAFRAFILQYLHIENRTGWFPKKNILSVISDLFSEVNAHGCAFARSGFETGRIVADKKKIIKGMRQLLEDLPGETHKTFQKKLADFVARNAETFDLGDVSGFFNREDFPVTKDGKVPSKISKQWKQIRQELSQAAESESLAVFNCYIDIFQKVMEDLKSLTGKEDVLFLSELNRRARLLFDEKAVTVPELYYRLATRLKHFLIDEFQDTSPLQWRNLYLMVEEALSTGGSLFYVGDKKQAVYRFRGADATLFDSVKEHFRDFNVIPVSLNQNYRSQKEIVDFTNEVFSETNLKDFLKKLGEVKRSGFNFTEEEASRVLETFKDSRQASPARKDRLGGFVRVEVVESKNKDERNEWVREKLPGLIAGLKERFNYSDIALLTRKNDEVEILTEWLIEAGIPVESEKTMNIRNNAYIKEVVSFLKFLNSPIDNLSFVSFLTGDIFSRVSGLTREELEGFIFSLRNKASQEKSFHYYREFRERFRKEWEAYIEEFFRSVGFVPLYELVISIYGKFGCLKNFSDTQGFFMRFLELIKEQEEERYSLSLFLEFFDSAPDEDLYVKVSRSDAVKVLTVHKSKGLGFGVVVLPFLEMNVEVGQSISRVEDDSLVLRRIDEKYRAFSAELDSIYRKEYVKSFIDELNNIYVALTRAAEELYIFLPQNTKRGVNPASLLVLCDPRERGRIAEQKTGKKQGGQKPSAYELSSSQYGDWIGFLKDEFKEPATLNARNNILRGEVLHYSLSLIGNLLDMDKELVIEEALRKTRLVFPFAGALKDCEAVLRKLLDDERFKPFFLCREAQVFQEKEVVDRFGNIKRMDRLIVGKSDARIIDYKSSKDRVDQDRSQVAEYMKIVSMIYPDKDIKGFLVYLDSLHLEEVSWKA